VRDKKAGVVLGARASSASCLARRSGPATEGVREELTPAAVLASTRGRGCFAMRTYLFRALLWALGSNIGVRHVGSGALVVGKASEILCMRSAKRSRVQEEQERCSCGY
jgi:hypothetical protein